MSPVVRPVPVSPAVSAAEANEAIRRFVAGRLVWTPEALGELARLRGVWMDAVRRETTLAA